MADIKNTEEALKNNVPYSLKLCMKLAELESHWHEVVGRLLRKEALRYPASSLMRVQSSLYTWIPPASCRP